MDHVDLSGNQLTVLPKFLLSESIKFRGIALHENPLRCNCEDKWIRGWLKSLGQGLIGPCCGSLVRCGSPYGLQNKSIFQLKDEDFCPENEVVHIVEVYGVIHRQFLAVLIPTFCVKIYVTRSYTFS